MVDIYGRAGQLDKALEIIHVSSCHEDPVLWRTLLGSCKIIHRNLELEEVAIYEETDAAQGFQCRGLLPGWSWIEIDDQVHKFVGVSSNMDLIGQLGVTQSGVYSHMVVELSAVESSICYSKPLSVKMTPQRNKRRETQQPSPQHEPNMQSSSFLAYPPGYRFVPTDAEIIYYYLKPFLPENKKSWPIIPIHHANIYESNPQQLTAEYKKGNLTEWFFISERTKIKRNGQKQKRVDHNGGYWHSKAVTKKIKVKKDVVGYKTTLNYFVGKQPNGERTNWLMQEYWLESSGHNKTVDYALCKIYLSPTAQKNMKEEDVELEEEAVQPRTVEIQQPQPPQFYPTPTPLVDHALKSLLTPRGIKREVEEEEDEKRKRKKKEGDVDHALKIHLTARGIKREVEEEEDEKRKRKKKEGGVEAPKEELEQLINSHQNSDNDDSFFIGFVDTHLLHIDIESSVSNCCLKKSSDEN
ncbi:hypothetical protein Bca52824_047316 [Brassica carinata]|uniref:NAC domain-containing protein n=1 Tax=Brassica carinata TaxID=52824 RepID=A0A8X7RH34_BRACI|nr:hypothetical protein Bca52824_047316 [Brassica carinata]